MSDRPGAMGGVDVSLTIARDARFRAAVRSRALTYLPFTTLLVDFLVIVFASGLAAVARDRWDWFAGPAAVSSTFPSAPAIAAVWLVCLLLNRSYTDSLLEVGTDEFRRLLTASLFAAGLTGVGCYVLKYSLPRGFYFMVFAIGLPLLFLGRIGLRRLVHGARRHGSLLHNVLLVGSSEGVDEIVPVLRREDRLGYHVIGCLTPGFLAGEGSQETDAGVPRLGDTTDLTRRITASGADVVFFVQGGLTSARQMRQVAWDLEDHDIRVVVAPSITDVSGDRVSVRPIGGLPLIHLDPPRALDASRWGKRALDVVGSAGLLLVTSPLLALAALRVKLHDGGPVLFRQTRTGRHGQEFQVLKLRTMVVDAEAYLARLHESEGYTNGLFKMKDDPRITKPGRWLRRLSVDELPQLVNVLRGDMSLVGPRPPLPHEVEQYENHTARRLHVRPGLTGLWQVSGRSNLSFDEAIRLDLYYVDNWSMVQDLWILARTLRAVVRSDGAF